LDLVKGALAGAVATWALGQVTTWLYARERSDVREREERVRGGVSADQRAAEHAAAQFDVTLSESARQRAGTAVHWATGITAGALYAIARTRWRPVATTGGLPFGAGFFLAFDELMNPVLRLTPGPRAFPWQAHVRGLAGHLAFGATTELVLKGLDRIA
jgi:uncharacterized membrane protein YagU involved in acid resistance